MTEDEVTIWSYGCQTNEVNHSVDENFDLHIDFLVPLLFDCVQVLSRVLI